ncbi:MAG: hypothetical protein V9E84_02075 [Trichococcus flocculiformis]
MAGLTENTIFDNAAHIADLAKISPDMTIMPGGGITKDNLADLEKVLEFNRSTRDTNCVGIQITERTTLIIPIE